MLGIHRGATRPWRHLTYANVVSTLALVFAMGGTAAAAVMITSNKQVAPNTISGHTPPSGDHANVIAGSINNTDLANNPNELNGACATAWPS
jgi:hypothetical protein